MNCFMFPGQPLSRGATLPDDADFQSLALLTRDRTGFDLESFSWLGSGSTDQVKLQVYGVAMSLHHARRLRADGIVPALVAEHSMGIYPALAACGALPDDAVLELAWRAGSAMARMGETTRYALGCIIGLTLEPLLAIAENHGVFLANHNTSRHFLLSGELEKMEQAETEALENGAFSARLFPCDAPLHTPLMDEISGELRDIFSDYLYREPAVPLVNHIDQDFLSAADLAEFMLRELQEPVYWERTYHALRAAGSGPLFEVGVGDSLKKYNRWIDNEASR